MVVAILAIIALSATLAILQQQQPTDANASGGKNLSDNGPSSYPHGTRFIRIRTLESKSVWSLEGMDAQHVLREISDLKPDVLERFVSGPQVVGAQVPVAPGSPPMTVGEFLNASMKACGCYIIPRLSLFDYSKGALFTEAQNLRALPVSPQMRFLSLDNWGTFASHHTSDEIKGMFQQLYSQGWLGVGVNECNGYSQSYGYATFADFCVGSSNWEPDNDTLASIRAEPNIKLALLYIDFPQPMTDFAALTPNREAMILADAIAPAQSAGGFLFVYPIQQDFWNSATRVTTPAGPFKGQSLYDVMKGSMAQYDANGSSVSSSSSQAAAASIAPRPGQRSALLVVGGGDPF